MAFAGVTLMDVVFSFDTTGSMSQALDEVKGRVNDIIQKLQADIPGVKVGIIAHGDYCDAEHFYDIRSLDLSDSVADVVTFVNDTDGTGGGDIPECYELALQQAKRMSWRENSRRVLVMIGDAYPHEVDYDLNVQNIDWRNELLALAAMNVRIYGVQVQNDENSTQFFHELSTVTEGQHLQLANMGRVCEVIMGICYREQGPHMFKNYEEEVRHKEAEQFGPDLECLFGTLRHEESRTSDLTTILDRDDDDVDWDVNVEDSNEYENGNNSSVEKKSRLKRVHFDADDDEEIDVPAKRKRVMQLKDTQTTSLMSNDSLCTAAESKKKTVIKAQPKRVKSQRPRPSKSSAYRRLYREHVSNSRFKYNSLPWGPWELAVCPAEEMRRRREGSWKTVLRQSDALWRKDLLHCIPHRHKKCRLIFEMSLMAPDSTWRRIVSFHVTRPGNSVLRLPWYRGVFRSVRPILNKAVHHKCKIFIRWTRVTTRQHQVCNALGKVYNYAWKSHTQNGQKPRLCF